MSVTQPADSGGGNANEQILQVADITSEISPQLSSWAQLMEDEFIEIAAGNEGLDEVDGGESSNSPERRRKIPDEPPFRAQVTNISFNHDEEELLYYFGGEEMVKEYEFRASLGNADFEFLSRDGLLFALEKHEKDFRGKKLRVFVLRNQNNAGKRSTSRFTNDNKSGSPEHSSNYERRHDSFRNRGNHNNSQTSLNSDRNSRYNDSYHQRHNHYGTLPAGGFDRRGSNRGYNYQDDRRNRNNFQQQRNTNYERQNSGPQYGNRHSYHSGSLQRSGSYQHGDKFSRHGAPVSARSRTDSHSTNFDHFSRASSRMSIDDQTKNVSRKVSAANPFGDAKPVDTQTRLLELEKRQEEKERAEQDARLVTADTSGSNEEEVKHKFHKKKNNNYHGKFIHHSGEEHREEMKEHRKRESFEQGAPPGSITIKKREHHDGGKQREEECSTPPVDPVQYPTNTEQYETNFSLPPHNPYHKYSKNNTRPTVKTYVPRTGQVLQKSATMGEIQKERREHEEEKEDKSHHRDDKKHGRGGNVGYRNDGHRRSSFSGSESGRGENKTRGASKSGSRGGMTRPLNHSNRSMRAGKRAEADSRKASDEVSVDTKEEKVYTEAEHEKKEIVEAPLPDSVSNTIVEEGDREESEPTDKSDSATPSTPKKKSDRKKEKKKEAKMSHLSGNRFAALLHCPQ